MSAIVSIKNLSKRYDDGLLALDDINLDIKEGEILALLGANGAGKTTLISIICGLVNLTSGNVKVGGMDIIKDYREVRKMIGLVPQELNLDMFAQVWETVSYSRGLNGKAKDKDYIAKILKSLNLYDKKNNIIMELSGGMKRRVLIAKALSYNPKVLFLDEPTAGVDVELRKEMWNLIKELKKFGVTIILTTHYIEEAEEISDRVGVIKNGRLLVIDEKKSLMTQLGRQNIELVLRKPIQSIPTELNEFEIKLSEDGNSITFDYNSQTNETVLSNFLKKVQQTKLQVRDINSHRTSLEEIFVDIINKN